MISAVEVFVDYSDVYVFHVCLAFFLFDVYGVGNFVDVYGVVECYLFLESECCLLCCHVV